MAVYKITLYRQFDKRNNSTAHPAEPPSGLTARPYECSGELVDGCDILNPVIAFKFNPEEMAIPEAPDSATIRVVQFNYAYIQDFRRCYFIKNWRHEFGMWFAEMGVDVLASYKNSLMMERNEVYVLRSASEKNDNIVDTLYPVVSDVEITSVPTSLSGMGFWKTNGDITNGYYVVGIINGETNTYGSVSYYVFTPAQLRTLMNKLMGSFSWLNVDDVSQELTQALFNPFQYFVSCMWFPTMPTCTSVSSVKYGWWSFSVPAYRITEASTCDISAAYFRVEKHPDSKGNNSYLNTAPFRTITGFFEPWGVFDIAVPPDADYIYLNISVDYITGSGVLKIWRNATKSTGSTAETVEDILAYRQAQIGVPIQLSQLSTNVVGVAENAVNTVGGTLGSLFSGNIGGAIANAVSGIVSAAEESVPKLSTKGINGSFLAFNLTPRVVTRFRRQAERNNDLFGSPLCENRNISDLSGFVQCAKPSLQLMGATETERSEFNRLLERGIYYE